MLEQLSKLWVAVEHLSLEKDGDMSIVKKLHTIKSTLSW
jgi:hypothetical protein